MGIKTAARTAKRYPQSGRPVRRVKMGATLARDLRVARTASPSTGRVDMEDAIVARLAVQFPTMPLRALRAQARESLTTFFEEGG